MMEQEPGSRIGGYELLRPLGEGSQASVWLARAQGEAGFERLVALKLFHARERGEFLNFADEARTSAALRSPNLVSALDFGQEEGQQYLAMEYVVGPTLGAVRKRLRRLRIGPPHGVVLDIGLQVARGLSFAHELRGPDGTPLGLLHRDIKPSNIIIDHEGVAKLMDFGISLSSANLSVTSGSVIKGTPYYMAPEQWRSRELLTPASDLFSIGCVLWELVTGKVLFKAEDFPGILDLHRERSAAEEAAHADAQLPGLGSILQRLLARRPEDRMGTARELEAALTELRGQYPPEEGLRTFGWLWRAWDDGSHDGPLPGVLPRGEDWQPLLGVMARQAHPLVPSRRPDASEASRTAPTMLLEVERPPPFSVQPAADPTQALEPPLGPGSRAQLPSLPTTPLLALALLLLVWTALRPSSPAPDSVDSGNSPPASTASRVQAAAGTTRDPSPSTPVRDAPEVERGGSRAPDGPDAAEGPEGAPAAPQGAPATASPSERSRGREAPEGDPPPHEALPQPGPEAPTWQIREIQLRPAGELWYDGSRLNEQRQNRVTFAPALELTEGMHRFTVRTYESGSPRDREVAVRIPTDIEAQRLRIDARQELGEP